MARTEAGSPLPGDWAGHWEELSDSLGLLIRRARQAWSATWTAHGSGLTTAQFTLLLAVAAAGPTDQQTIGAMAALDKSTTGNLVDRLDRLGYISATADPTNRRRKFVRITDLGRRQLAQAVCVRQDVHDRMTASLTPAEYAELQRLLHKVIDAGSG